METRVISDCTRLLLELVRIIDGETRILLYPYCFGIFTATTVVLSYLYIYDNLSDIPLVLP